MKHDKSWMQRYCDAYSYGHNVLRLATERGMHADLARFAHAYADITEEITEDDLEYTLDTFTLHWKSGEVEPDVLGTYHRAGPWALEPGKESHP